jgi:hypothetical protein
LLQSVTAAAVAECFGVVEAVFSNALLGDASRYRFSPMTELQTYADFSAETVDGQFHVH